MPTSLRQAWVYPFGMGNAPAGPPDRELLGGKGASLAEMSRAGLPVPPGFTITTECCRAFFDRGQQRPEGLDEQVREHLAMLEAATGRQFGRGRRPLLVSVRSGAAVSMPGMMDTILNCGVHPGLAEAMGDSPAFWAVYVQFVTMFSKTVDGLAADVFPPPGDGAACRGLAERCLAVYREQTGRPFPIEPWAILCECINAVFRSWQSERAIAYRRRNDVRVLPGTAVSVQAMFPSEVSGILFTEDPNDLAAGQMVIESSYGLGEAVVSGDVDPDRFVVRRSDLKLVRSALGQKAHRVAALGDAQDRETQDRDVQEGDAENHDRSQPSLTPAQLGELGRLGLTIERHFGRPMDIEWGWAEGRFSLLQCRPIRGLEIARDVEVGRQEEIARLRALAGGRRRVWLAHNLGETLPAPTPLTWDIVRQFMTGSGGFGLMYRDLGYRPSPAVCRDGFLELIGGRIYADPLRLGQLFWGEGPMGYDLDALSLDPGLLDRAPLRFDPDRAGAAFFLRLPRMVWSMLRAARLARRLRGRVAETFEKAVLPPYLDYVRQKRAEELSAVDTAELCRELDQRRRRVLDEFGKESLKPGFFGGLAFGRLQGLLVQTLGPAEGTELAFTLSTGPKGDTTVAQSQMLFEVAHGRAALGEFMHAYGHRALGEMELAEPRWRENPQQIEHALAAARRTDRSPADIHAEHAARRQEAERRLPEVLGRRGAASLAEDVEAALAEVQSLLGYRESGKHYLMMGYELLRLVILELAGRWDLGRDIFFLRLEELAQFEGDRSRLEEEIARRKVRWQALKRLDMAQVIDSERLDDLGRPQPLGAAAELRGEPVAAGAATGPVRIVFDPRDALDLGAGYVLVCPSTDPGWTSLFVGAAGLVVERGGVLSHGAIVARDFGIPAVVCPGATGRLRDGQRVRVDGGRGLIQVVEEA